MPGTVPGGRTAAVHSRTLNPRPAPPPQGHGQTPGGDESNSTRARTSCCTEYLHAPFQRCKNPIDEARPRKTPHSDNSAPHHSRPLPRLCQVRGRRPNKSDGSAPAARTAARLPPSPRRAPRRCTIDAVRRQEARPQERHRRLLPVGEGGQPVPDRRDQSIKDEAKKLGVKHCWPPTPSRSSPSRSATSRTCIAKGAQLLVIAPLNSDGWEPVLQQAAAKKIPVLTDRPQDQRQGLQGLRDASSARTSSSRASAPPTR